MKVKHRATAVERNPALASIPRSQDADTLVTEAGRVGTQTSTMPCRFEISGVAVVSAAGADNLE
jgi:hypothetical protein